ncbi:MAG TPA: BON domain-containing protein [Mesorhizobium sp.]|jgi:osmotically-inducible protein OsmY|uniref:BON domain-containing protein n=1 Tax=Mesorhizobium sp. TaxID=1871066 RepID=UPI002DDD8C8D|nr:BON domain-containing protein [Mesorhizobium sp.]HEV2507137.1 BON domain-containing protein [Mesorhizobium sp.]
MNFYHSSSFFAASADYATAAAIKCLLAYVDGLEGCEIDVQLCNGEVILEGRAPCSAAADAAARIASQFTSRPVRTNIILSAFQSA